MQIKQLTKDYAVMGQLEPGQVQEVAAIGFRSLICNRPDGEVAGQPRYEEVAAVARALGLEFRFIPIVHGQSGMPDVEQTAEAIRDMPAPILAYCRSGARSETVHNAALTLINA